MARDEDGGTGPRPATGSASAQVPGMRGRVLAALRAMEGQATVDDVAERLALHRNTARFHLEALAASGLVEEGRQPTGGKGRPRAVFWPTPVGARSGQRNYQLLASVLAEHLASTSADPLGDARAAGRAWGQRLALTTTEALTRRSLIPVVVETLTAMGFEPLLSPPGHASAIELRNCPFREVVDERQDVVCAIHAGLLEGMTTVDQDAPTRRLGLATRLHPFATPDTCLVEVLDTAATPPLADQPPPP